MTWSDILRRGRAWPAAVHDPVPMIDRGVVILTVALLLCLISGITLAAEQTAPEQRRACRPDASPCCDELASDADCTIYLRQGRVSPGRSGEA